MIIFMGEKILIVFESENLSLFSSTNINKQLNIYVFIYLVQAFRLQSNK